jgi:hypothetical protein
MTIRIYGWSLCVLCVATLLSPAQGAETEAVEIADGALSIEVGEAWKKVQPRVRIIELEYSIPAVEGDAQPGRLTVMAAGGSVEANITRWQGQFTQPDGGSTKERTKTEEKTIAGQTVHLVDISGNYKDQRGPFAPAVQREGYRMLAAIVVTDKFGNYFIKAYGPKATMSKNEAAFKAMIDSLKVKKAETQ